MDSSMSGRKRLSRTQIVKDTNNDSYDLTPIGRGSRPPDSRDSLFDFSFARKRKKASINPPTELSAQIPSTNPEPLTQTATNTEQENETPPTRVTRQRQGRRKITFVGTTSTPRPVVEVEEEEEKAEIQEVTASPSVSPPPPKPKNRSRKAKKGVGKKKKDNKRRSQAQMSRGGANVEADDVSSGTTVILPVRDIASVPTRKEQKPHANKVDGGVVTITLRRSPRKKTPPQKPASDNDDDDPPIDCIAVWASPSLISETNCTDVADIKRRHHGHKHNQVVSSEHKNDRHRPSPTLVSPSTLNRASNSSINKQKGKESANNRVGGPENQSASKEEMQITEVAAADPVGGEGIEEDVSLERVDDEDAIMDYKEEETVQEKTEKKRNKRRFSMVQREENEADISQSLITFDGTETSVILTPTNDNMSDVGMRPVPKTKKKRRYVIDSDSENEVDPPTAAEANKVDPDATIKTVTPPVPKSQAPHPPILPPSSPQPKSPPKKKRKQKRSSDLDLDNQDNHNRHSLSKENVKPTSASIPANQHAHSSKSSPRRLSPRCRPMPLSKKKIFLERFRGEPAESQADPVVEEDPAEESWDTPPGPSPVKTSNLSMSEVQPLVEEQDDVLEDDDDDDDKEDTESNATFIISRASPSGNSSRPRPKMVSRIPRPTSNKKQTLAVSSSSMSPSPVSVPPTPPADDIATSDDETSSSEPTSCAVSVASMSTRSVRGWSPPADQVNFMSSPSSIGNQVEEVEEVLPVVVDDPEEEEEEVVQEVPPVVVVDDPQEEEEEEEEEELDPGEEEVEFVIAENDPEYSTLRNANEDNLLVVPLNLTANVAQHLDSSILNLVPDVRRAPGVRRNASQGVMTNGGNGFGAVHPGYLRIQPETVMPFQMWPDRNQVFFILRGAVMVRSAGGRNARSAFGTSLFGKRLGRGTCIVIRKKTVFSFENRDKTVALLGVTEVMDPDPPTPNCGDKNRKWRRGPGPSSGGGGGGAGPAGSAIGV